MREKRQISFSVTAEQNRRLKELAAGSQRTRAGYLRHLVTVYLRHIEEHPEDTLD